MITLIIVIVIVIVVTIYMLTIDLSETNMKCEVCGTKYSSKYYFLNSSTVCNECFKKQSPEKQAEFQQQASENSSGEPGSGAIGVLRVFAWLDFFAGIIGGFWILSTFGSSKLIRGLTYSYSETVTNPVGIAVGIAVILQGVFVCAFFLVVASIAENLIAIRKNTAGK